MQVLQLLDLGRNVANVHQKFNAAPLHDTNMSGQHKKAEKFFDDCWGN